MDDEIRAAAGAHLDLGPGYDDAVAEGLVERIGAEIDKRIDARLGPAASTPAASTPAAKPPARRTGPLAPVVALGSLGLGVAATAIVTGHGGPAVGKVFEVIAIWLAIMCVAAVYLDKD
jgi:hypothetical protein